MSFRNDTSSRSRPPQGVLPPELEAAYRTAVYVVETPFSGNPARRADGEAGGVPLRFAPGVHDPAMDRLLAGHGVSWAVFLTAENPHSRPVEARENAARTAALRERLGALGLRVLPGESRSATGDWREVSFLVLGLDEAAGIELAGAFEQSAFVLLELGEPPKLVATASTARG